MRLENLDSLLLGAGDVLGPPATRTSGAGVLDEEVRRSDLAVRGRRLGRLGNVGVGKEVRSGQGFDLFGREAGGGVPDRFLRRVRVEVGPFARIGEADFWSETRSISKQPARIQAALPQFCSAWQTDQVSPRFQRARRRTDHFGQRKGGNLADGSFVQPASRGKWHVQVCVDERAAVDEEEAIPPDCVCDRRIRAAARAGLLRGRPLVSSVTPSYHTRSRSFPPLRTLQSLHSSSQVGQSPSSRLRNEYRIPCMISY